jgi:hypothetical protein
MSKKIKLPRQAAYPKKIYFSDTAYKVKFQRGLDCFGKTNDTIKVIAIKKGLSERETLATFIHEILHVIEFETPVKLKHKTIYKLEKAIVEILLDNFL